MSTAPLECQLRPGTGQQAGVEINADGYHTKVTGVGAAVGLHLLHEGTAREGAHLLAIELRPALPAPSRMTCSPQDQTGAKKLLLFFNDTRIAAGEGLCDLKPAQLPPRITMSRTWGCGRAP